MNVMTQEPVAAPPHPVFNQQEILAALLRGWKLIVIGAAIGVYFGITYLQTAGFIYQAQMQVTPVQPGAESARLSAAAGLASLAGITLPASQQGSDFRLYLDSLQSRSVADRLAADPEIMHQVFSGEWDAVAQRWREPPLRGRAALQRGIKNFLGLKSEPWHPPDGETLLTFFNAGALKIEQDPRRPYIAKVIVLYSDRAFAVKLLQTLHQVADDALRELALARTAGYITYLSSTLNQVTVAEHRIALTAALSEQVKASMMARSGTPFAAEQFEKPWAGTLPVYPSVKTELVTRAVGGGLVGAAAALLFWLIGLRFGRQLDAVRGRLPLPWRRAA
jgi:hypothetical protein